MVARWPALAGSGLRSQIWDSLSYLESLFSCLTRDEIKDNSSSENAMEVPISRVSNNELEGRIMKLFIIALPFMFFSSVCLAAPNQAEQCAADSQSANLEAIPAIQQEIAKELDSLIDNTAGGETLSGTDIAAAFNDLE